MHAKRGIVTHEFLKQKRPYIIVIIFIIAAVITPTTDPVNQSLLAVPMCLLYESLYLDRAVDGESEGESMM